MRDPTPAPVTHAYALRLWLLSVAAMIVLTLAVGGITRLTESGLSITEWRPVTGVLPPFGERAWEQEFKAYQAIPQYQELNRGMSLEAFKVIYWWEWTHRMLARATGVVFLVPFLVLLWRGKVPQHLRRRLWTIFGSGAFLGVVGWWMVASGLAGSDRINVSPYRLAFHLTLACAIYAAVVWTAQQLLARERIEVAPRLRIGAGVIAGLLLLQIYLGALVAGTRAGLAYNTWPLIDGAFIPAAARLWPLAPAWRNVFENILTVQFDHRMLAYAIWLAALCHAYDARRSPAAKGALLLAGAVTAQAALGVATLLQQAPLVLALAHQLTAIVAFTVAIVHAERTWYRARFAFAAEPTRVPA
ncbi:MAG: COX15/CtaA family protein [Pseudolabrys sp.]|nr:COX15/CtaA family protein [Pseudolabrys sp.]